MMRFIRFPKGITAAALTGVAALFLSVSPSTAQQLPKTYELSRSLAGAADRPLSNSAVDLLARGDTLWVGGGKGIDRTADGGATWTHFGDTTPFDLEDIAALEAHGGVMWASLAGSEDTEQGDLPKGLGLVVSTDFGRSWTKVPQPMEATDMSTYDIAYGNNTIKALAVTTDINNITYDIAVTGRAVFIASFAGMLRTSTDGGATFVPVVLPPDQIDRIAPTDTLDFDLSPVNRPDLGLVESLNHRVFSVHAMNDDTIWVGTAGGINRSTDGGLSWRKFTFNNQTSPISGNFVVGIGHNVIGGVTHVWAATVNALNPVEYRAVSVTTDMGETWRTSLRGEFTHNFGFKGDVVYAATNGGVFRSDDAGNSWLGVSRFIDSRSRRVAAEERCYAVAVIGDDVYVSNGDGLMRTRDGGGEFFGQEWTIFRAAQPIASSA
ncbi:MAG: exo-alpha-sialidase, partial [Bacteroidetes bacterium]|nr:exo-alpha-sialidase [Bacteroidota bacterium]